MSDTKKNTNKKQNQGNKSNVNIKKYCVIRDGHRVSDRDYDTKESAISEYDYWNRLTLNWDPTSKVSISDRHNLKK